MAMGYVTTLSLSAGSLVYEGKVQTAVGMVPSIAGFVYCVVTNQTRNVMLRLARFTVVTQAIAFWFYVEKIDAISMRRGVLVRGVINTLFYESLEEVLINMLIVSVVLNKRYCGSENEQELALLVLPMYMFVCAVLPMRILGVMDTISVRITKSQFSAEAGLRFIKGLTFFTCAIPIHIVSSAYVLNPSKFAVLGLAILSSICGLLLKFKHAWGVRVNRWIAPNTLAFHKPTIAHRVTTRHWLHIVVALLPVLWYMGCVFLLAGLPSLAMIIALCENKLYHEMQSNLLILVGTVSILTHDNLWLSTMLMFVGTVASFACMLLACGKEVWFSHVAQEHEAESFLSHAIKQRFASVASAVQLILIGYDSDLLRMVVDECKLGHARCFASSVFRKLEQGQRRPASKRTFDSLQEQLKATPMANLLLTPKTQLIDLDSVWVQLDWEIVHLVCCDLARTGRRLIRVWLDAKPMKQFGECWEGRIHAKLDARVNRDNLVLLRLIAEINGEFNDDVYTFTAKMKPRDFSAPLPTTPCAKLPEGFAQLRLALMDDNALIRKNFVRLMHQSLGIQQDRILIAGETLQDCLDFPQRICAQQIDIAIFDQNLDFDDDEHLVGIKGNELALQAKHLGFTGCLILHSSDVNLAELLMDGVFHGAVEKSANGAKFVQGLANAWSTYRGKTLEK